MDKNPLGTIENARTEAQRNAMEQSVGTGRCPFCDPLPLENKIIRQGKHWRFWENPFPYPHHAFHFVYATMTHIADPGKLAPEAVLELHELQMFTIDHYRLPGGGLVMRFGDPEYNAGTIRHLHAHLQVPNKNGFAIATFYRDFWLGDFFRRQKDRQ